MKKLLINLLFTIIIIKVANISTGTANAVSPAFLDDESTTIGILPSGEFSQIAYTNAFVIS